MDKMGFWSQGNEINPKVSGSVEQNKKCSYSRFHILHRLYDLIEPATLSDIQKDNNQDWVYVDDIVSSKLEYHHLSLN